MKQNDLPLETLQKSLAQEAGTALGQVLVLKDRKITDLSPTEIETYRRRYGVAPQFTGLMTKEAGETRRFWLRWEQDPSALSA
jgi:ABC-type ATPase involved in cell division